MTDDIEFLKPVELSSKIYIDNIDTEYDERNWIDMIDNKETGERDHIGENDEERLTDDIDLLKMGKLISQKNIDNIDK